MSIWNQVFIWALIATYALGSISTILTIGKDRKPITHGRAAGIVGVNVLVMAGLLVLLAANR